MDHLTAVVHHVERHAFDHSLLILDTKPDQRKRKTRFYFDKWWIQKPGFEQIIREAWGTECEGSPMFQITAKIKKC